MADQKKMVEAITSMEEDFPRWYTDVVGRRIEPKEAAQMAQPQYSEPLPTAAPMAAPMPTVEPAMPAHNVAEVDDLPF